MSGQNTPDEATGTIIAKYPMLNTIINLWHYSDLTLQIENKRYEPKTMAQAPS
jgi:hypothetical protein